MIGGMLAVGSSTPGCPGADLQNRCWLSVNDADNSRSGGSGRFAVQFPLFLRSIETMHSKLPLQGHHCSFGGLQESNCAEHDQRQPDQVLEPNRGRKNFFNEQHRGDNEMANNDDDQIGRKIVSTLMRKIFAAERTVLDNFQVLSKQAATGAPRAPRGETTPKRLGDGNRPLRIDHDGNSLTAISPYINHINSIQANTII